jgi:hypothetical protein
MLTGQASDVKEFFLWTAAVAPRVSDQPGARVLASPCTPKIKTYENFIRSGGNHFRKTRIAVLNPLQPRGDPS